MNTFVVVGVVTLSIGLMLVRPRSIAEVWWVGTGALLLVGLRLLPWREAAAAVAKGADVYFFLTGMMLLSELARDHGVFDWLSSVALRRAGPSSTRLFTTVYAVGTLVTVFMSNDATAVVLTPAILAAVRKARVGPLPYLFVCALIANAASFVLPISNPANLVVFRGAMPSLGQWLQSFALPSALSIGVTYLTLRWIFRGELAERLEQQVHPVALPRIGAVVLGGLGLVAATLLVASAFDRDLGLPTLLSALLVTAAVSTLGRRNPLRLLKEVSWSTLLLVAGLFVLVEAMEHVGALDVTQRWLQTASALPHLLGVLVVGFAVGAGNNIVNNLPLGLLAGATLQASGQGTGLGHAVLIGVDLGPNLAVTGSLATLLWLLALRKEKLNVSFWEFLKVGSVVMPLALGASLLGSVLTNLIFSQR